MNTLNLMIVYELLWFQTPRRFFFLEVSRYFFEPNGLVGWTWLSTEHMIWDGDTPQLHERQVPTAQDELQRVSSPQFYLGLSENSVPLFTQWLMIRQSLLNGYFIGNINPTFSDKPICRVGWVQSELGLQNSPAAGYDPDLLSWSPTHWLWTLGWNLASHSHNFDDQNSHLKKNA